MSDELPDFDADTAVTPLGDDRYTARLRENWNIVAGPNGGYLAALFARAMTETVADPGRGLRSLTVHYLARADFDDIEIEVATIRAGRSVSTLRAEMRQEGRPVCAAMAAFSVPWTSADTWHRPLSAQAFDGGDHPAVPAGGTRPPLAANWSGTPLVDAPFFSGEGSPRVAQWIRAVKPRPLDAIELVAICDAIPPAGFPAMREQASMPTVDLTVHIRASFPLPDPPADPRVFAECTTHHVADGFADEDCNVWAADGRLLAQSRQLAITR